ncbi:GNAT family N-acetyltransferase [Caproicibacter sp. BJN0012]|uniref:GNAT family N-acetyltransferase n=1 Tax=Caproicibacter sp. BJN0012 TaxID=3110227 RepID=UPI002E16428F|nr:GNAT family N-acetyltransferase [Caproicibacter sp. BJN0012]
MEIRQMRIQDYEEVRRLWAGTPGIGLRGLDDSKDGISGFLARNPKTCFVALNRGEVIGVILCGNDGRRGYIYHLAVCPSCRGKGVGRSLVGAVVGALKEERINKAALVVFRSNDLGNHFWSSIGFEEREDLIYRDAVLDESRDI